MRGSVEGTMQATVGEWGRDCMVLVKRSTRHRVVHDLCGVHGISCSEQPTDWGWGCHHCDYLARAEANVFSVPQATGSQSHHIGKATMEEQVVLGRGQLAGRVASSRSGRLQH